MKAGKLLTLNNERSIFLYENEKEEYIDENMTIHFRSIGANYESKLVEEAYVTLTDNKVNVLDGVGNIKFYFPLIWLDTDRMKMIGLAEKGLVKFQQQ